jgi:multidrug resistance efflux pump|tara:strand:- start:162 stop:386 length:225 start_codon:yes stop_codon:yes gene_type:complete
MYKEQIEAKLKALEENKIKVVEQIRQGQELVQKGQADLNAILGAIQVCEQLKTENDSKDVKKPDKKKEDGDGKH